MDEGEGDDNIGDRPNTIGSGGCLFPRDEVAGGLNEGGLSILFDRNLIVGAMASRKAGSVGELTTHENMLSGEDQV